MSAEVHGRRLVRLVETGADVHPDVFDMLTDVEWDAVQLVAAAHESMDWERWGGMSYWTQLTERVVLARSAGPTLAAWWGRLTAEMGLSPSKTTREIVAGIAAGNRHGVLDTLSSNADWVITLVRVCVDAKKDRRDSRAGGQEELSL